MFAPQLSSLSFRCFADQVCEPLMAGSSFAGVGVFGVEESVWLAGAFSKAGGVSAESGVAGCLMIGSSTDSFDLPDFSGTFTAAGSSTIKDFFKTAFGGKALPSSEEGRRRSCHWPTTSPGLTRAFAGVDESCNDGLATVVASPWSTERPGSRSSVDRLPLGLFNAVAVVGTLPPTTED